MKRRQIAAIIALSLLFGSAIPITIAVFQMSKSINASGKAPQGFNSAFADAAVDYIEAKIAIKEISVPSRKEGVQVIFTPHGKYANDDGSFAFPSRVVLNGFIIRTQGLNTEALNYPAKSMPIPIQGEVNFNGDAGAYPYDKYASDIRVQLIVDSGAEQNPPNIAPIRATITSSIHEWKYTASQITSTNLGEVGIHLDHERAGSLKTFVFFQLFLIALMGLVSVIITSVIILRDQKMEIQYFTWLGALVFALPAVRGHMPDTPEIGVMMDLIVYLPSTWLVTSSIIASSYRYIRLRIAEAHLADL